MYLPIPRVIFLLTVREGFGLEPTRRLVSFLPDKNIFYQYKADILDPNKLQTNTVVGMYQDRSNMIWLATSLV